ncbi:CfrBI family restriction endonuclease [Acinetobacter nectaris]|uniref:CfrBI family restriction endonuclease n=1 Tax=Acinetobacter nectaris TaxID=1219382 RepID=UPI001F241CD7|nr:CfrBI family restriction endonuclease [Acinetobacter nectaris]MCF9035362.1 CfrBI family restriction endonuclease [Acinetobacter nectaris]
MHTFEDEVIQSTIEKLIKGQDYREEVINSINVAFFDFCLLFFRKIVDAKFKSEKIDLLWYKINFINSPNLSSDDLLINSGLNKKTVSNIYGTTKKDVAIKVANNNIEYLENLLSQIDGDEINININLEYNDIKVSLNLQESLLVINALATKKLAIRGGAWSSIGKKVEKPLIDHLCDITKVPLENRNNIFFKKDKNLDFDREVDYKLISKEGKIYRVEVKLMGKGNPESADATIARDTQIFVADTLSLQNKAQLKSRGVYFLELKENSNIIKDFVKILNDLDIPNN